MKKTSMAYSQVAKKDTADIGDYSTKERNYFLVGMFGQNIIYSLIGAALNLFYTDVLLVSTTVVAIIMALSRVWDAVNDIIMGTIVDKTRSKWGKCRPYLKFIPLPMALATIFLFLPFTGISDGAKVLYICLSFLLWETLYTLGDVPLWGMTSLMTADENKRAKLISSARIVSSLGAVIIAVFAPLKDMFGKLDLGLFANTGQANYSGYFSEAQGYFFAAVALSIVGGILFRIPFSHIRERIDTSASKDNGLKQNLKLMFENKPFLLAISSSILGCTKMLVASAGLYFCKWVLGNGSEGIWIIVLGGSFIGGTLIAMALSTSVAVRLTKKRALLLSSYLSAIPFLLIFFFSNITWLFITLLVAAGFFSGFSDVYHTTMVADSVDYMEWKSGKRLDGVFFSGLNFSSKLTASITLLLSNGLLSLVNYTGTIKLLEAQKKAAAAAGSIFTLNFSASYPDIAKMMLILITIVPAIGCILQALPIHFYNLSEKRHKEILEQLEVLRKANKNT